MGEATEAQPIDKSSWGPGPWQDEPDRVEFRHEGFPCLIVRQPDLGHLCGYVAVPPGHPWHQMVGTDDECVDVHGGVTYASKCRGDVCHVPEPGESDDVFWIGFDFAHIDDLVPCRQSYLTNMYLQHHPNLGTRGVYKGIDFVKAECRRVAEQAKRARK